MSFVQVRLLPRVDLCENAELGEFVILGHPAVRIGRGARGGAGAVIVRTYPTALWSSAIQFG